MKQLIARIRCFILHRKPAGTLVDEHLETDKRLICLRFAFLSVLMASGLALVTLGYANARLQVGLQDTWFWLGLVLMFAPAAWVLVSVKPSPTERLAILAMLGFVVHFVKIWHSPLYFTFHDELVHVRTAKDILSTNELFTPNPLIPTSALYPGLEIVTTAIAELSGLSVFVSGTIVMAISRFLMIASLFYIYGAISGSYRLGGMASLIYLTNPSYMFFNAQYSYESLAIPLAAFILYILTNNDGTGQDAKKEWGMLLTNVTLLLITTLAITHHLTTYALLFFMISWSAIFYLLKDKMDHQSPLIPTVYGIIFSLGWLFTTASFTINYLWPYLTQAIQELFGILMGQTQAREIFTGHSDFVTPLWEQLISYCAVLLLLAALPIGILHIWRRGWHSLAFAMAFGSLLYPASLGFRFTYWGVEAANRLNGYAYIALSFVVAVAVLQFGIHYLPKWLFRTAWVIFVAIILVGGTIIGWPQWARMPGPYLVAADMRSIEPQGIQTAAWTLQEMGPDNRISTDRINALLQGALGEQRVVTVIQDGILVAPVFFARTLGEEEINILQDANVQYVLIDRRLSEQLPRAEVYFERGEPGAYRHTQAIAPEALRKFDDIEQVDRLYDSGDIVIYDIRSISTNP